MQWTNVGLDMAGSRGCVRGCSRATGPQGAERRGNKGMRGPHESQGPTSMEREGERGHRDLTAERLCWTKRQDRPGWGKVPGDLWGSSGPRGSMRGLWEPPPAQVHS